MFSHCDKNELSFFTCQFIWENFYLKQKHKWLTPLEGYSFFWYLNFGWNIVLCFKQMCMLFGLWSRCQRKSMHAQGEHVNFAEKGNIWTLVFNAMRQSPTHLFSIPLGSNWTVVATHHLKLDISLQKGPLNIPPVKYLVHRKSCILNQTESATKNLDNSLPGISHHSHIQ